MKNVWYTCPFVPPEWIAAYGLRPRHRRLASAACGTGPGAPEGVCPYANAFLAAAVATAPGDATIATTLCDQMRRAAEAAAGDRSDGLFLMHVPAAWQSPNAHRLYLDELRRLGRFLERMGGRTPSDRLLADTAAAYDSARRGVLDARADLSAGQFAELLAEFQESGAADFDVREAAARLQAATSPARPARAPGIALVGGPLMCEDLWIFDRVEALGGRVVLDATVGGELTLPGRCDRRRLAEEPLAELADAYFGHIPHPARRPNSGLYRFLRDALAARGADGVLLVHHVWCDKWRAELHRLKEWARRPAAELDLTDDASGAARAAARIQSLIEMLA